MFHLYILEKAIPIYCDRKQKSEVLEARHGDHGDKKSSWGNGNAPHVDCAGGYTDLYTGQNPSNSKLKMCRAYCM